jgi:hypothetical protein
MINDCMKSNKFVGMIQPKKINDEHTLSCFAQNWMSWKNNKF